MKFYKATIADRNPETYEVFVNFDNTGRDNETAKFLSSVACDPLGGGLHTLPPVGSPCLVMEDEYFDYWVMGYYNKTNPGSANGWILDDKYPRPILGDNDTLLRHVAGNYVLQTSGELRIWEGLSARMSLVGKTNNTFDLYALRVNINNSAGYFSWQTINNDPDIDTPSTFEWKIQKNFEQFADIEPSDYAIIRAGSIFEDESSEVNTCVLDISTTQYVDGTITESATTYFSLSRDDDDNGWKLEISDSDKQGNTSYTINSGYYHNWTITDPSRTMVVDWLSDDGETNLKIDLNGSVVITGKDDGNLEFKTDTNAYFVSPLVNLGSENAAEPLALGESLMAKLNELIQAFNGHIHPTPAGPSSPTVLAGNAPSPFSEYKKTDFLSEVSFSD
jgi:hypothetical protein